MIYQISKLSGKLFSLNYIYILSLSLTVLYLLLKTHLFFQLNSPIGDEASFLKTFKTLENNGFYSEWSEGNLSPLFYLVAYLLNSLFNNPLISFRVISILSTILSLYLLINFAKNYLKIQQHLFTSCTIFIISFLSYRIYWQGINDPLFHLIIISSFYCIYNIHYNKNTSKNIVLLGILLGLLFGIRCFLAILVIPCYAFFFRKNLKSLITTYIITIIVGISFHGPSLYNNNTLGSVNKNPNNGLTWSQKNFLSQQKIYEGVLQDGNRVTWKQLQEYIDLYGENSLPKTVSAGILKKPLWRIQELFNDFWLSIKNIYFQFLGLGIIIIVGFTFYGIKHFKTLNKHLKLSYNFILFFWLHTIFISFVVLITVEVRWYTSFIYLSIIFYHFIIQEFKYLKGYEKYILKLNFIILSLFQLKFILTDYNLLSSLIRNHI